MRGSITMKPDRSLSGTFDVGVAESLIKVSKSATLDALFGPPKDGFRWLSLKIGGSPLAPTDNFKELFDHAVLTKTAEPASATPTFEDLTTPRAGDKPGIAPAGSGH